jgi:phosphodiester glycosidase
MRHLWAPLIALTLCLPAQTLRAAQPTTQPATQPFPGITYREEVRTNPPQHLHIVTVDLTNPAVHLKVSPGGADPTLHAPWQTTLLPVSDIAARDNLAVAVNGSYFAPKDAQWILGRRDPYFIGNWARAIGWFVSDGVLYSQNPAAPDWPTLLIDPHNRVSIGQFNRIPAGAGQAVAGEFQLVTDGRNTGGYDGAVAPRTAVGYDRDGKTLFLFVVDGRRPEYSAGMSPGQVGDELIRLGAWEAINLDSGGSSTMVVSVPEKDSLRPQVMNLPSDGHDLPIPLSVERPVANALGVRIDPPAATTQPAGQ